MALTLTDLEAEYLAQKSAVIEQRQPPDLPPYVSEPVDPDAIRTANIGLNAGIDPALVSAIIASRQEPGPVPFHTEEADRDAIAAHNQWLRERGYK